MALNTTITSTKSTRTEEHNASTNYGSQDWLSTGEQDGSNNEYLLFVEFDLSGIASSTVVITDADLILYQHGDSSYGTSRLRPYRTTSNWNEGSVTWNTNPNYNTTNIGTTDIANGHTGDVSVDITDSVIQNWARGNTNNYGFYVRSTHTDREFETNATDDVQVNFRSDDWGTSSQRPRLVISYYDVPDVTSSAASDIKATEATFNGNITSENGSDVTTRGFKYGLTETDTWDESESGSFATGAYSLTPTGLDPNTTYHYRAYATNSAGTSYGAWQQFTTLKAGGPGPIWFM